MIRVEVQKLREDAIIPAYQSEEAAGFDLHAIEDAHIPAGERMLIKTGLAVALPKGYELQVRPRSGLAFKHGITVLNSPGTVDSDYRGELMVLLMNHGKEGFEIQKGERIAQAVLKAVIQADFEPVEKLSETARGASGFGSTGR